MAKMCGIANHQYSLGVGIDHIIAHKFKIYQVTRVNKPKSVNWHSILFNVEQNYKYS